MANGPSELGKDAGDTGSRSSAVPLLGESIQASPSCKTDNAADPSEVAEGDAKAAKRRFWGLGKKKEEMKKKGSVSSTSTPTATSMSTAPKISNIRPVSPITGVSGVPQVSKTSSYPYGSPASPGRNLNSSSPAPPSPASSQIFERSVQEDGLAATASPAIPAHITTENHIPPVLDASSAAITDDHLTPDNVEIVMHAAHQPAAVTVTGTGTSEAVGSSMHEHELSSSQEHTGSQNEDPASNYGALDSADVRRLSFISFADVVHAEHADHSGTAAGAAFSPVIAYNRSPSPARAPRSTQALGGSPASHTSSSPKGMSDSGSTQLGRGLSSTPASQNPPSMGGDLTIETMRQALRKTGSGDLSGARSAPMSAVGEDDGQMESSLK